jgi:hypothetical protein
MNQRKEAERFTKSVEDFAEQVVADFGKVLDLTALHLHRSVVMKTPVDTGRARASWTLSRGIVPPGTPTVTTLGGSGETGEGQRTQFRKSGPSKPADTIFIANNLDYIEKLENGSSQQAPRGMLAITVRAYKRFFRAAGLRIRRG